MTITLTTMTTMKVMRNACVIDDTTHQHRKRMTTRNGVVRLHISRIYIWAPFFRKVPNSLGPKDSSIREPQLESVALWNANLLLMI